MMAAIRDWMLTLTGAAAVCALATALCPPGRVRRVLALVCGAVMTVALVSPIIDFDLDAYFAAIEGYERDAARLSEDARKSGDALTRSIIERDCAAYILDKAESLGLAAGSVSVRARWNGGYWAPDEAYIRASASDALRQELSGFIEAQLGIPAERQYWEAG